MKCLLDRSLKAFIITLFFVLGIELQAYGPKIELSDTLWQAGDVKRNEIKSFEITIKNTGSLPLTLKKVRGTCNCIIAKRPKKAIPPNGKAKLLLAYRGKGLRLGVKKSTIYIHTNVVGNQIVKIRIIANIVSPIPQKIANPGIKLLLGNPKNFDIGALPPKSKIQSFFTLTNPSKHPIEVNRIQTNCRCIFLKKTHFVVKPGATEKIPVIIDTQDKYGNYQAKFFIHQNNLKNDSLTVNLKMLILAGSNFLELNPNKLEMDPLEGLKVQKIKIKNYRKESIEVQVIVNDTGIFCSAPNKFNLSSMETKEIVIYPISFKPYKQAYIPLLFIIKHKNETERLLFPVFFRRKQGRK